MERPKEVWMPVRLIMNNKTLTILEGTDYENQLYTFNLKDTNFLFNSKNKNCWGIQENKPISDFESGKAFNFCPFGVKTNAIDWVNEWQYDYSLFKNQCAIQKMSKNAEKQKDGLDPNKEDKNDKNDWDKLKDGDMGDDGDELDNKLNQIKAEIIRDKETKLQKHNEEAEERLNEEKLNSMELEAINKEFNLEELIEKDEAERERKEEANMYDQLKAEEDKRNCLMKTIKEKEIENQYNMMKDITYADQEEQKKSVKQEIIIKREELKKKIEDMRLRSARRLRRLKQHLKGVKAKITDDVNDAYKKGHYECHFREGDNIYCKARFTINPESFGRCIKAIHDKEQWCGVCCNAEIGSMYPEERQRCMKKCNFTPPPPENIPTDRWFGAVSPDNAADMVRKGTDISFGSVQNQSEMMRHNVSDIDRRQMESNSMSHSHQSSYSSSSSSSWSSSQSSSSSSSSGYNGFTIKG